MNKLDKLLKEAHALSRRKENRTHIIDGEYCLICKRKCRYINNDNVPKIIDDIV